MTVEVFAPAKINLALHVTGQRNDGYHLLDSLVMHAGIGDRIFATFSDSSELTVTGPYAADVPCDASNLVLKAAALMGVGARIVLEKNLPAAGGLGGGSADAAATLRALAQLTGRALPAAEAVLGLGADVPVCLETGLIRMRGIGENLDRLGPVPDIAVLLVNPGQEVATPAVFQGLKRKTSPPMSFPMPDPANRKNWLAWLTSQRNDLEPPAMDVAPVIGDVLECLRQTTGCHLARMSGSGATCFGLYPDPNTALSAADVIRAKHADWWVASSMSGG